MHAAHRQRPDRNVVSQSAEAAPNKRLIHGESVKASRRPLSELPSDVHARRQEWMGFLSSSFHPPAATMATSNGSEDVMVTRSRWISSAAVSTVAFGLLALLGTACSSSSGPGTSPSSAAPVNGTYSPSIDPANFVATIDNPYWPLKPGTTYHYEGVRGTTPQTDDEVVTHQTKQILGVTCVVVRDTVSEHGAPVERTFDWYAQDKQGNVRDMGEDSLER